MYLITGGTGFVGHALIKELSKRGCPVIATTRQMPMESKSLSQINWVNIGEIYGQTDWKQALHNVDAVIHCAARAHVLNDTAVNPLESYRRVNVKGTLNLAVQAAHAGVKRFVFVSSIKVNGEATILGHPFKADDIPANFDPYGISKREAEDGLHELSAQTGMKVIIVRPPLIYGPGVKANFASMMRWISRGIPLPLGGIQNARSMVSLDNLVDLLITCLKHPAAVGQVFLASDGQDVSTPELIRLVASAMGKRVFLFPVPVSCLEMGAALLGKPSIAQRLCGSLQIDIQKNYHLLGWTPPLKLREGLIKTVEGFKW
jgi:nucleoside-diphosphate-sugar epimerase